MALSPEQNLGVIEAIIADPELADALLRPRCEDPDPLVRELERALGIVRFPGV